MDLSKHTLSLSNTAFKVDKSNTNNEFVSNKISSVSIRDLSMISLNIDGRERVCLAQISNTLLKKYSYNEIHNRRVALGINCVQCTPIQLEILRNAGAMPVSSRRCGMITKKEAERLVKSFLDDNKPPSLPESFYFDVEHKCEYGCKGMFYPARYNSSRAKCIRCVLCNLFYSPNKFIFHSHETASSKYAQSGTINFNSWRRHIFLINEKSDEGLNSAWEDVKSIFNSGKRKRGQVSEESDTESNFNYSFSESCSDSNKTLTEIPETTKNKFHESQSQCFSNTNLPLNLMTNFLNPIYSQNQMQHFLPEFFQLNRNFLLQNNQFDTQPTENLVYLKTQEILKSYFLNRQLSLIDQEVMSTQSNHFISNGANKGSSTDVFQTACSSNGELSIDKAKSAFKQIEKSKKIFSIAQHLE